MLTSGMFGELSRIRAEALREEARRGSNGHRDDGRPGPRWTWADLRSTLGTHLVSVGTRLIEGR